MPDAKIKPWRSTYTDSYRGKKIPKPPSYKSGASNYSWKNRTVKNNAYENFRPGTADSIDRRYHGTHMLFATEIDQQADDLPLDLTVSGSHMQLASRNPSPHVDYMDDIEDSYGADQVKQYVDAELETLKKAATDKKDYHWIVWPQPDQQETRPKRPQSAINRYPKDTQFCRPASPINFSSAKEPDYHWSVWPQPPEKQSEAPARPHTALGIHNEDFSGEGLFGSNQDLNGYPEYDPQLQSWVTAGNDYEKDIAAKMTSMYLSQTPRAMPDYMKPKREDTFTYGYGNRIFSRQAPGHYAQSWFPYTHNSLPEDMVIKGMAKRLENSDPVPGGLYRSHTEVRPFNRRPVQYPRSEDYIHQHSMFTSTQPLVRGHFIIHPDWVSERITKKKLNTVYGRKKSGLRYGTNTN